MHKAIALCLLSLLMYAGQAAAQSAPGTQVKKLKVNDVELAYTEEGKGDTVVFVHGGGTGDLHNWEVLRPLMSAKVHYVSVSRRYHYPNPWLDDGRHYTMAQHVEDVAAFIRALNVGKVHLVGNSYGGAVVGRVALKYPELLRSVIVGEGLVDPPSDKRDDVTVAPNANLQKAVQAGDVRKAAILQYDDSVGEPGAFERLPAERQEQLLYDAKTLGPEQRRPSPLMCDQLRTLSVPILLLRGEKTNAGRRARFEATMSCLPESGQTAIIPGAPHSWYMRNPKDSANAILAFIAKR